MCTACPANSNTTATGAAAVTDCLCKPGYGGASANACTACAVGWYKPALGFGSCTACPTSTGTAAPAATALSQCLCDPGYIGPAGGPCQGARRARPGMLKEHRSARAR